MRSNVRTSPSCGARCDSSISQSLATPCNQMAPTSSGAYAFLRLNVACAMLYARCNRSAACCRAPEYVAAGAATRAYHKVSPSLCNPWRRLRLAPTWALKPDDANARHLRSCNAGDDSLWRIPVLAAQPCLRNALRPLQQKRCALSRARICRKISHLAET